MIPPNEVSVPYLSSDQMREVDRLMVEAFRIELIQMMENAGRNLAHLARLRFLNGDPHAKQVVVLAGTGGNGGGALVCARWLHNAGANVRVCLAAVSDRFTSVPAHQLDILYQMGVPVGHANVGETETTPSLIVDGIIGYSLRGAPHGTAATLIEWANSKGTPVLSLDVPSGLDATTGAALDPSIRATATMTLALPKTGLRVPGAKEFVGELYLADIGVPPELYAKPSLGLRVEHIFAQSDIVRLG